MSFFSAELVPSSKLSSLAANLVFSGKLHMLEVWAEHIECDVCIGTYVHRYVQMYV
jgi:hypothetical protein